MRSTHRPVPSQPGEPVSLVTSSDPHTTVVSRRSFSERLESPRADPRIIVPTDKFVGVWIPRSDRRVCRCLDSLEYRSRLNPTLRSRVPLR